MIQPNGRPTARELAENGGDPAMQIAGRPAAVCPYCGCGHFLRYRTEQGQVDTFYYQQCRNGSCGKKFYVRQPAAPKAVIVREVGGDVSNFGEDAFTIFGNVG